MISNQEELSKNYEEKNSNFTIGNNFGKTISIFQPRLLRIRGKSNTMQKPRIETFYAEEKKKVKHKIKELKREEKEIYQDESNLL